MYVKVTQSCPTLCDPMAYAVHGILQARILEWVAFSFSRGSSQPCLLYCVLILNQLSQCLCFHSRPRKGGIYRKEESVCEKEIYLDTGSSFSIHIYGKTEIFYF